MTEIIPFKGIRFNPEVVDDLAQVLTPPYDVISPEAQKSYHDRHPYNVIRLILGQTRPEDTSSDNCHTRAASFFRKWLADNILRLDHSPVIYYGEVEFMHDGHRKVRSGLIGLVRLEPFDKGIVLPHEKTFSRVKSERLDLMKVTHANFCPVFGLYSDPANTLIQSVQGWVDQHPPLARFSDDSAMQHTLWQISAAPVLQQIAELMQDKAIYIADGHHRYETALNYQSWYTTHHPDHGADHPSNYIMMYLASMNDTGLVILPSHRLLSEISEQTAVMLLKRAEAYFDIRAYHFTASDRAVVEQEFLSALEATQAPHVFGTALKHHNAFYLLALKPGVMQDLFGHTLPKALLHLDVSVLTRLVLIELLGFDQARLDNNRLIRYTSDAHQAIDMALSAKVDLAFILKATKVEQVRKIAEEGLVMPRKSTYFFPKVLSGQVMHAWSW